MCQRVDILLADSKVDEMLLTLSRDLNQPQKDETVRPDSVLQSHQGRSLRGAVREPTRMQVITDDVL